MVGLLLLLLLLNSSLLLGETEGVKPLTAGSNIAVHTSALDMYSDVWLEICRIINVITSSCPAAIHCFPSFLVRIFQTANIFWLSVSINYRALHMVKKFSITNVDNCPVERIFQE